MKLASLVLLMFALFFETGSAQVAAPEWKTYSHTPADFTIEIPKTWEALSFGEAGVIFSVAEATWLEAGMPAPKYPWLVVLRTSERCFDSLPGKLVFDNFRDRKSGAYREAYVCKHNLEVMFGFWEGNSGNAALVFDFKRMLESLKRTSASR